MFSIANSTYFRLGMSKQDSKVDTGEVKFQRQKVIDKASYIEALLLYILDQKL